MIKKLPMLAITLGVAFFTGSEGVSAGDRTIRLSGAVSSDGEAAIRITAEPVASRWQKAARLARAAGLDIETSVARSLSVEAERAGEYWLDLEAGLWSIRVQQENRLPLCLVALPLIADRDLGAVQLDRQGQALRVVGSDGRALKEAFLVPESITKSGTQQAFHWLSCSDPVRADPQSGMLYRPEGRAVVVAAPGHIPQLLEADRPTKKVVLRPRGKVVSTQATSGGMPLEGVLALGERVWPISVSNSQGRLNLWPESTLDLLSPDGRLLEELSGETAKAIFAPPVSISGRVVEYQDDLAIGVGGALVWSQEDPGLWTRADAQGRFSLPHVPLDPSEAFPSVVVGYAAPGYGEQQQGVGAGEPGGEARRELENVELWLPRRPATASFVGSVVDQAGEPIPDAQVVAIPAGDLDERARLFAGAGVRQKLEFTTDVLGTFSADIVAQRTERWDLVVTSGERPPLVVAGLSSPDAGQSREVGSLTLPAPWSVSGRVVDVEGRPVEGAMVESRFRVSFSEWSESFTDSSAGQVLSAADGQFSIPGRAPVGVNGGFDLHASKPGYRSAELKNFTEPRATELKLVLELEWSLSGRVSSKDGEPIEGALLFPGSTSSHGSHELMAVGPLASTGPDGRFTIADFPPKEQYLTVEAEGFATERLEVQSEQADLDITLEPSAGLAGSVVSQDGSPVRNAVVQAGPVLAVTDGGGAFHLDGLPDGRFLVHAHHDDFGRAQQEVELHGGEKALVSLTLRSEIVAKGRVIGPDQIPVPRAVVRATDRLGQPSTAFTNSEGRFQFLELDPGAYSVTASATGLVAVEPREFVLSETSRPWLLEVERRGAIDGTLVGLDHEPWQVRVHWSCPGKPLVPGKVSDDGTFMIEDVSLGDCWVTGQVMGSDVLARERLVLSSERPSASLELSFSSGSAFEGRLIRDSRALDGAQLRLWADGAVVGTIRSNSLGDFFFSRVPEGSYRLSVEIAGQSFFFSEAVTVPGAFAEWHLETGRLQVEVRDLFGNPLPFARANARPLSVSDSARSRASCFDGICQFQNLSRGRYEVTVGARGYGIQELQVVIEGVRMETASAVLSPTID
ncbi:MAG: carboxypeptidase regulatory-like domain-containing protein [Acidobacteriota bacterium]